MSAPRLGFLAIFLISTAFLGAAEVDAPTRDLVNLVRKWEQSTPLRYSKLEGYQGGTVEFFRFGGKDSDWIARTRIGSKELVSFAADKEVLGFFPKTGVLIKQGAEGSLPMRILYGTESQRMEALLELGEGSVRHANAYYRLSIKIGFDKRHGERVENTSRNPLVNPYEMDHGSTVYVHFIVEDSGRVVRMIEEEGPFPRITDVYNAAVTPQKMWELLPEIPGPEFLAKFLDRDKTVLQALLEQNGLDKTDP